MSPSPSTRIVADLRERIASGELAPGDRLPSTREITRQWGVAMATATRALALLREEGLARAVPGVGTIVLHRPDPRATAGRIARSARAVAVSDPGHAGPSTLSAASIVLTAVAVADAEGLDGLSMRRVAAELGAGPMSLYRHVVDKDDLVLRMVDAALREARLPDRAPSGWRVGLEVAARALWTVFRRHPWLAAALSVTRPQAIPGGLAFTEWVLAALPAGLSSTDAFDVHLTLFTFVRGLAINLETEAAAQAVSGLTNEEWMAGQERRLRAAAASGRYPYFERLLTQDYDFSLDRLFERGLRTVLDGLAASLDRRSSA